MVMMPPAWRISVAVAAIAVLTLATSTTADEPHLFGDVSISASRARPQTSQSGCSNRFSIAVSDKYPDILSGDITDSSYDEHVSVDDCAARCAANCGCALYAAYVRPDGVKVCEQLISTGITWVPSDTDFIATVTYGTREASTVYGDPLIVGGNNRVFYFTGQPDTHFCLVSDAHLQVNTYFIARLATPEYKEMTWVGALNILTGSHAVEIKVARYATWEGSLEHLEISYNGERVELEIRGKFKKDGMTITRVKKNVVDVSVPGVIHLKARAAEVAPRLWTPTNCFVHLELDFKGLHLTENVHGILGQTYRPSAASLTDQDRPYEGVGKDYITSSQWATDCKFNQYGAAAAQASNPILTSSASRRLRASAAEEMPTGVNTMVVHGMVVDLENTESEEVDAAEPST